MALVSFHSSRVSLTLGCGLVDALTGPLRRVNPLPTRCRRTTASMVRGVEAWWNRAAADGLDDAEAGMGERVMGGRRDGYVADGDWGLDSVVVSSLW